MSQSEHATEGKKLGRLRAKAPTDVRISLTKGPFEQIASQYGEIDAQLPEGIYTIRWHAAGKVSQNVVRLTSGSTQPTHHYDNEVEKALANEIATGIEALLKPGFGGSAIVLCVNRSDNRPPAVASRSIRLRNLSAAGGHTIKLRDGIFSSAGNTDFIGFVVDPGTYIVTHKSIDRRTVEQTVNVYPRRITVGILNVASAMLPEKVRGENKLRLRWGIDAASTRFVSTPRAYKTSDIEFGIRIAATLLDILAKDFAAMDNELFEVASEMSDPFLRIYAAAILLGPVSIMSGSGDDLSIPDDRRKKVDTLLTHAGIDPLGTGADLISAFWRLTLGGAGHSELTFNDLQAPPMLDRSWQWATAWSAFEPGEGGLSKEILEASSGRFKANAWLVWRPAMGELKDILSENILSGAQMIAQEFSDRLASLGEQASSTADATPSHKSISIPDVDFARLSAKARKMVSSVSKLNNSATLSESMSLLGGLAVSMRKPVSVIAQQVKGALDELNSFGGNAGTMPSAPPPSHEKYAQTDEAASGSKDKALFFTDPHKGQFGGSPSRDGYVVYLQSWGTSNDPEALALHIAVKIVDENLVPGGMAKFYLHPTFDPSIELARWKGREASFICYAVGGFTLGVEVGSGTKLELDLALIETLPQWFRDR